VLAPQAVVGAPFSGRRLQVYATPVQGEGFYTVEEAAQALKLTPDRIRQMLRDGELEGVSPQEGGASGWKIPIRVIHGRERQPPASRSESPPTPAQPQRDDAAENSREPAAPSTRRVTVQDAILETSVDTLLEAKDETIADLRDRVAFLEQQLESRVEEIRRRDHIIAALTERIPPAIGAPDHQKSVAEEPARVTPPGADGPREEGSQRPWWRRAFRR
jgi:excisionase family DNA binding protein